MKATSYIREDFRWAHSLLELVVQDVTPEQADWQPPGLANPIGATYAHAVCGEDVIVRQMLRNDEPLLESSWKGRTGISEPQLSADFEWARRVQVELPVAWVLSALVISHLNNMASEISALKGVQGVKGYPW